MQVGQLWMKLWCAYFGMDPLRIKYTPQVERLCELAGIMPTGLRERSANDTFELELPGTKLRGGRDSLSFVEYWFLLELFTVLSQCKVCGI